MQIEHYIIGGIMDLKKSFEQRPAFFEKAKKGEWRNWQWQQQNALRSIHQYLAIFPDATPKHVVLAREWARRKMRFQLTPYMLSLGQCDALGNPEFNDPIFRQFLPSFHSTLVQVERTRPDEYRASCENWEAKDMLTPILQHKYPHKSLLLLNDVCFGYCLYCFRSLASKASEERHGGTQFLGQTLQTLAEHPEIQELIISGGDPLVESDQRLAEVFAGIRRVRPDLTLRIHTRVLSHNPYRVTKELCALFRKYDVRYIGVQIAHPAEITSGLLAAIKRIRHAHPALTLFSQFPLLKGINDNLHIMEQLCSILYEIGTPPKYCFHDMPNTPAASELRTSVRQGAEIFRQLQGRVAWLPRYVIASQQGGKITVPLDPTSSTLFRYETDERDWPVVRAFSALINDWIVYPDSPDYSDP